MLCEAHGLHVIGEGEQQYLQCLNCGYVTSDAFKGTMKDNAAYSNLPEEMRIWAKEENDRVWIPSMITLPFGTLYPINKNNYIKPIKTLLTQISTICTFFFWVLILI